jgi:hypothetical protein
MKKCFKCDAIKPLDEFYKHSQMKDGRLNKCKECTKKDSSKHRADNLEYCRAYDRKRANLPHRLDLKKKVTQTWLKDGRHTAVTSKYRQNHPEKYKAHLMVKSAINKGTIKRGTMCGHCGMKTEKIQAHHPDYSKPLEVEWLCVRCHGLVHHKYPTSILF